MLNGKYISVYEIIERVFDTFDSEAIEFSVLIRHMSDALLLIGAIDQMEQKVEEIDIVEYRGILPKGLVYINQTRECNTNRAMRISGNSFHASVHPDSPDRFVETDLTYTLNNSYIFTNFESGKVEMACAVLPVDERGYPLIPDDIKYKMALEYYILERIAFKLLLQDKISDNRYDRISRERNWYMAAAQSRAKMPSVDKMETIKNAFSRMLIMPLAHSTFFTAISGAEEMQLHPHRRR